VHEYALVKELKISPDLLEDQYVEFPSFKDWIKWLFGKPIKILSRKGLSATKVDELLAIIDAEHIQEQQESENLKRSFD
jgi:hypothetical protein